MFFGHNLPYTNARWSIKGSNDADFHLVFLKEKNNPLSLGPRARWRHPKNSILPPIMTSPTKKLKSKTSKFFKIETIKFSACLESLNISLALAAGELWPNMNKARSWLPWALMECKENDLRPTRHVPTT